MNFHYDYLIVGAGLFGATLLIMRDWQVRDVW